MTTSIDWNDELVEQLDWHWRTFVRPRIELITEEQYHWEPVPGWSVRPGGGARSPQPLGTGPFVLDWQQPAPTPPPLTTIAWRLAHLVQVLGIRASNHFGDGSVTYANVPYPGTADAARKALDEHYGLWTAGVRALGVEGLSRPCGPSEGPYAEAPLVTLVLHVNREMLHHGAEVLTLLDLHRSLHPFRPQGDR